MKTLIKKSLLVLMVAFIAVFTLGVSSKVKAASYVETSFGEGKFFITSVYNGQKCYLPATTTSSGPVYKTFSDVSEISDDHLWTVTATGSNYYIQNSEGKYLYTTNTNNGVRVGGTKNAWTYDSKNNSLQDSVTKRFLGVYNSSNWRCYTTVNQSNYKESSTSFVFFKVDAGSPSLAISGNKYTEVDGVATLTATLTNISGNVVWSSSNTAVATVDASGNVTAKSFGQTIISAVCGSIQDEVLFTVFPTAGSELTIADALLVCKYTDQVNCAFTYSTSGTIESIDTAYDSGYDNITVTITDGTNSIKAFRLSGGSDLDVGQKIKVTGTLVNYGGNTPEFIAGCTYQFIVDDSAADILEALNNIDAYMSLAYKYTHEVGKMEVETITGPVEMAYAGETTTNMGDDVNNASTLGLDENIFSVIANKCGNSNNIGLNKNGDFRLYANKSDGNGNELIISTLNEQVIESIEIVFGDQVSSFTVNGENGSSSTSLYEINSTKVTIKNISTAADNNQVRIVSITVNLEDVDPSEPKYIDVHSYSNVDFRIKCGVDKALAEIEGVDSYGIKVSTSEKALTLASTGNDELCLFAVVSLGDALTDAQRLDVVFTVQAYVVIEGVTYVSELTKSYSVREMVEEYYANPETTDLVASLYNLINE